MTSSRGPGVSLEKFEQLACDFREAARRGDLPEMDSALSARRRILQQMPVPCDPRMRQPEVEQALQRILEIDREATRLLEAQRSEVGEKLAVLDRGRRGLTGYRSGGREPKWIDERG